MVTKFFSRMFDAVQNDEDELLRQVQEDLKRTETEGKVESNQVTYEKSPKEGVINVVDKANNEVTEVSKNPDSGQFTMNSDEQSFLLPQLTQAVEALTEKIDKMNKEEKPSPETSPENSDNDKPEKPKEPESGPEQKTEQKEASNEQKKEPSKVLLVIDGKLVTGEIAEKVGTSDVKVKIPSLNNTVVVVPESSCSVLEEENSTQGTTVENEPKRNADQYRTFSPMRKEKTFSIMKKTKTFSPTTYAVVYTLDDKKVSVLADNPFNYNEDTYCIKDGFKDRNSAEDWMKKNQSDIQEVIKRIKPRRKFSVKK